MVSLCPQYIYLHSEHFTGQRATVLFNAKSGCVENMGTEVENIFVFFYASAALFCQVVHVCVHNETDIYKLYFT